MPLPRIGCLYPSHSTVLLWSSGDGGFAGAKAGTSKCGAVDWGVGQWQVFGGAGGIGAPLNSTGLASVRADQTGGKADGGVEEAMCLLFTQPEDWPMVYTLVETVGIARVLSPQPEDGIDLPILSVDPQAKVLLVIDQFEEVFTVCPSEEERRRFIQRITEIAQVPALPLAIVTTMRADFVEPWLSYGTLVGVVQQQAVWLGSLEGQALIDAIIKPAEQLGYRMGESLLELILADVAEERNCLPLAGVCPNRTVAATDNAAPRTANSSLSADGTTNRGAEHPC